jgi:hypothetical protein
MSKLLIGMVALLLSAGASAKEIASVKNNYGGVTVLTDENCPVDPTYLYGIATGTKTPTIGFCWRIEKDTVMIYLPLNQIAKIPLKLFNNPDKASEPKPHGAI